MSKVRSIEFKDYKAFPNFVVSARERNVLVGPNNAGKSTTLDAFRVTFDALRFAGRRNAILKTQGNYGVCSTWIIPISAIQSDLRSCIHNFGEGPASISIKLDNGSKFTIIIPSGGDIECFLATDSIPRKNTGHLREKFPLKLIIVPTLSPLEQNEELVLQETVERNRFGRLASRNFRNFWLHRSAQDFERFSDLVALGWPGLKLLPPEVERGGDRPIVRMYFRDGPNVREVQWAGFGFQVWMQTMMHLLEADQNSTLILDEPDIYLHPDLQHRLVRIIGDRVGQYFVASHSTEIINEVEPGDVLIIRADSRGAKRIQGESGYADVYAAIGSSENAQFARLAKTKKVLYFEGKDARTLSRISNKLGGMDFISNASVTLMKTDGFSNWSRVSTSSWVFENFFGFHVPVAAIFDRDYRCDAEVDDFLLNVNTIETQCRVWPFKEIENILLVPDAIKAAVKRYANRDLQDNWQDEIDTIVASCFERIKSKTLSARIGSRISYEIGKGSKKDISTISAMEEQAFTNAWVNDAFKRRVVPGKAVFADIAGSIQSRFAVTLTSARIIDELEVGDVDPAVFDILRDIQGHLGE